MRPKVFELVRHADVSGVSGTGVVAEGCLFTDGSVALRWRGDNPATAVWPDLDSVLAVHGHHGSTELRWLEPTTRQNGAVPLDDLLGARNNHGYDLSSPVPARSRGWAGARHLR